MAGDLIEEPDPERTRLPPRPPPAAAKDAAAAAALAFDGRPRMAAAAASAASRTSLSGTLALPTTPDAVASRQPDPAREAHVTSTDSAEPGELKKQGGKRWEGGGSGEEEREREQRTAHTEIGLPTRVQSGWGENAHQLIPASHVPRNEFASSPCVSQESCLDAAEQRALADPPSVLPRLHSGCFSSRS